MKTTTATMLSCSLVLATGLCAQRMPVPGDASRIEPSRVLQLLDLRRLGDHGFATRDDDAAAFGRRQPQSDAAARLLRNFVSPALGSADDLQPLGDRWIAALADEQRMASVTQLFEAAVARRDDLVQVAVRLHEVPADTFRQKLKAGLAAVQRGEATTYETVVARKDAAAMLGTLHDAGNTLVAPTVMVRPLQEADVSVVQRTPYVRDYTLVRTDDQLIADPVIDQVWDGCRSRFCATFLPNGNIGLSCEVEVQDVVQPIAKVETTLPGAPNTVSIQLPRTSGVRLANVAELAPGSLVVLAAQKVDGSFLVATVLTDATRTR